MELDELRRIASLLIDKGSDVNAKHISSIDGYSPFMLAVELDEDDLVRKMLVKGADLNQTYTCPQTNRLVGVFEIAEYFKAKSVGHLLSQIQKTC